SRPQGLPGRQHRLHQVQALLVAHLRPAGDLGDGAQAALAYAVRIQRAHPDAGAEHDAVIRRERHGCRDRRTGATGAAAGTYLTLTRLMSNTSAWPGPTGERGSLPKPFSGGRNTSQRAPCGIITRASRTPAIGKSATLKVTGVGFCWA